jgi:hypothetical protein
MAPHDVPASFTPRAPRRERLMLDLLDVIAALAMIALGLVYARGCDRLKGGR